MTPPPQHPQYYKGAMCLLQILLLESLHLIWVIHCERAIQEKSHSSTEVQKCWFSTIKIRLAEDQIVATKIQHNATHINLVKAT